MATVREYLFPSGSLMPINQCSVHYVLLLITAIWSAKAATGQTIINIPDMPSPPVARDGEIVNVFANGILSGRFDALAGSEVNLLGGIFSGRVDAFNGSVINIRSGQVEGGVLVLEGATANVSGASINDLEVSRGGLLNVAGGAFGEISTFENASATLTGFDFEIDGMPIAGLDAIGASQPVNISYDSFLSGIFADGTPFIWEGSRLTDGTITLERGATLAPDPKVIHVPSDPIPLGLRGGQKMIVNDNTDNFSHRIGENFVAGEGSEIELINGRIGSDLKAIGATISMRGGQIGRDFQAHQGSVVNVSGGVIGNQFKAYDETTVHVSGGLLQAIALHDSAQATVSDGEVRHLIGLPGDAQVAITGGLVERFSTNAGNNANISGGNFRYDFNVQTATANISGGAFPDDTRFYNGSITTFQGFDFRVNNVPVSNLASDGDATNIRLGENDFFTGVLADGTPFAFTALEQDELYHDRIRLLQTTPPTNAPAVINVPNDSAPLGIRDGQTLVVDEGGVVPDNFNAGRGSKIRVEGGMIGQNLEAVDAGVVVNGGSISRLFGLFANSNLTVNGGTVDSVTSRDGSTVSVNGGLVSGEGYDGNWELSGGTISNVRLFNSDLKITGGRTMQEVQAWYDSHVEVFAGETEGIAVGGGAKLEVHGGNHFGFGVSSSPQDGITTGDIYDGRVHSIHVRRDSILTLHGGNFAVDTDVPGGSYSSRGDISVNQGHLKILGGAYGDEISINQGIVEIHGSDFFVDGSPVENLEELGDSVDLTLANSSRFSGVLADGTPFSFYPESGRSYHLSSGKVRFVLQPAPELQETVVTVSDGQGPLGARPGQTVILEENGFLDDNFLAGRGSDVIIRSGRVSENFEAIGAQVTVEGGEIGNRLSVLEDATVTIAGGTIERDAEVYPGGVLHLAGGLMKYRATARGGTFNMSDGVVDSDFDVVDGGIANISGGYIRSQLNVRENSSATISGGTLARGFLAETGSIVNMTGGLAQFDALAGSQVKITGGIVDDASLISSGAQVDVSGGGIGDDLVNSSDAGLILRGQHFEIDGALVPGLSQAGDEEVVTIADGQLFTGTLADGSPFVFSRDEGDRIGTVRLIRSATLPGGPIDIRVSSGAGPGGTYVGQQLTLSDSATLPKNFNAGRDSVVTILDGSAGDNFEAYAAIVNIAGGTLGNDFGAFAESEINISGGVVGSFQAYEGAVVNLTGGKLGTTKTWGGSTFNIAGGQVASLGTRNGSQIVWNGGTIASLDINGNDSSFEVQGGDFRVNGVPIAGLVHQGDSLQFDLGSGSILTGVLADGTPMILGSVDQRLGSSIQAGTMTLVRFAPAVPTDPQLIEIPGQQAPFAAGGNQTVKVLEGGELSANFIAGAGGELIVAGGVVQSGLRSFDAKITILDGLVSSNFLALGGTDLKVTGGTIDAGLHLFADSSTKIFGGSITETIRVDRGAVVDIFGSTFLLDNQPIPNLDTPGDVMTLSNRNSEHFFAVLQDGSELNWLLRRSAGRNGGTVFSPRAILRLHYVPEPATLAFAMTNLLALTCVRRRPAEGCHGQSC